MKTNPISIVFACFLASTAVSFAAGGGTVSVDFDHPENFTDVKDGIVPTDKGREVILHEIDRFIQTRAPSYLSEGQQLHITFTDIDLAGDFEPHHGNDFDRVRLMKDIYPPRLKFHFRLTGADGRVISEGDRKLTDQTYTMRIVRAGVDDSDFRFEKDLLIDWMHKDLAGAKSAGR